MTLSVTGIFIDKISLYRERVVAVSRKPKEDSADAGGTLTEQAAERIAADILNARLEPDSKLGVMELSERYAIGPTPIREALSRLSASGFVEAVGRRGFKVAPLNRDDLADLVWLRQQIEVEALRRSMRQGDGAWEASVIAALHLMQAAAREKAQGSDASQAFDRSHKHFHRQLLAACGSERLLQMSDTLYDQMYRYRCAAMLTPRWSDNFFDEHRTLADLVVSRDMEGASRFLGQHIRDVFEMVYPDGDTMAAPVRREPAPGLRPVSVAGKRGR